MILGPFKKQVPTLLVSVNWYTFCGNQFDNTYKNKRMHMPFNLECHFSEWSLQANFCMGTIEYKRQPLQHCLHKRLGVKIEQQPISKGKIKCSVKTYRAWLKYIYIHNIEEVLWNLFARHHFFYFCPLSFPGGSDDKESTWEYSPKMVEE